MKGIWRPTPGLCQCGCGQPVRSRRGRRLFRSGHNQYNGKQNRQDSRSRPVGSRAALNRINSQKHRVIQYIRPQFEGEGDL
jgi:hypothetical protein